MITKIMNKLFDLTNNKPSIQPTSTNKNAQIEILQKTLSTVSKRLEEEKVANKENRALIKKLSSEALRKSSGLGGKAMNDLKNK